MGALELVPHNLQDRNAKHCFICIRSRLTFSRHGHQNTRQRAGLVTIYRDIFFPFHVPWCCCPCTKTSKINANVGRPCCVPLPSQVGGDIHLGLVSTSTIVLFSLFLSHLPQLHRTVPREAGYQGTCTAPAVSPKCLNNISGAKKIIFDCLCFLASCFLLLPTFPAASEHLHHGSQLHQETGVHFIPESSLLDISFCQTLTPRAPNFNRHP